jgi:succinyl-CoA synthetase alpha subunit
MSILINKDTKVLVQGLTGKTGTFHTEQALAYHGTKMVGGINPKKGGETWTGAKGEELPIFATVAEGREATGAASPRAFRLPTWSRSRRGLRSRPPA